MTPGAQLDDLIVDILAGAPIAGMIFYLPVCIILAMRRDYLLHIGARAPDVYFLPRSFWFTKGDTQERLFAGMVLFFKFWDLGADDLLFRIFIVAWRICGLLIAAGAIMLLPFWDRVGA